MSALRPLALLAVCALLAAGCGADPEPSGEAPREPARTEAGGAGPAAGARTGAADLRARLTALLSDDAHLLGFAMNTGLAEGTQTARYRAALTALDENTAALADAIAGAYGRTTGERFLALWRRQVGLLVDDALARATGDAPARRTVAGRLARTRREIGTTLAAGNAALPAEATAEELEPLADGLHAYADALVARSPEAYERLREAGANATMTAKVLADGIARRLPQRFDGSATAGAAELRGTLTGLLGAHQHLLGAAAAAGAATGFTGPASDAARAALDAEGEALATTLGTAFGEDAGRGLRQRWRTQDDALLAYARAQATGDRAAAAGALADLETARADLAGFLASVSPQLPAGVVTEALEVAGAAGTAAIRAAVKASPRTYMRLREAADATTDAAALLADGIARQFPDRFPPA